MADINININIDGESEDKKDGLSIKKKTKKLKNGKETILELPEAAEDPSTKPGILKMMGF